MKKKRKNRQENKHADAPEVWNEVDCGAGNTTNNRSPKGNMWPVIPVALLCMIVKLSERKQGSGPEGDEVL